MSAGQPYTERELISRVKQGDRHAQYTLYRNYVDAMYHTVIRMVNHQADAQDIVQDCFIKVFEKIGTYRSDATLGAWIKRIAINTAINTLRKRQRTLEFASDHPPEHGAEEIDDSPARLDPAMIHQAVRALPTGCRAVVNLYAFEGYSHKEIAQILDITESTSKTQYKRAKSLLRAALAPNLMQHES
ncbi:MAG: RNA polymerase sigma factor [Saprospiraceae bacterium]|nr:RNA polymerase sigma factor [Saprospiraceae bacterium]